MLYILCYILVLYEIVLACVVFVLYACLKKTKKQKRIKLCVVLTWCIFQRVKISYYYFPGVEFCVIFLCALIFRVIFSHVWNLLLFFSVWNSLWWYIFLHVERALVFRVVFFRLWSFVLYISACGICSGIPCYIFLCVERALIFCVIYFCVWNALWYFVLYIFLTLFSFSAVL